MPGRSSMPRILRKVSVFLTVIVSLLAISPAPASAAGNYYRNYYLFGSSTSNSIQGDIYVYWAPGSPRNIDVVIDVYIGTLFATGADRCAMKLSGQLKDLNGNVWNVPDKAFPCTEALNTIENKGAGYSALRHSLTSDTSAAWIRPNICIYLYYVADPTVSKCAGDGAWMQYNGG